MVNPRTLSNWPLPSYPVKVWDADGVERDGDIQAVTLVDSAGGAVSSAGSMVTFTHTRPSFTSAVSSAAIAANTSRKAGSYIQNNTSTDFYGNYGATAAVGSQGFKVTRNGGVFIFNTTQAINCIQSSGGALELDVFEAT